MKVLYLFSHQIWFPHNKKIISPKCPHLFIQFDRLPLHFISFFQTMHSFPTKKKNYIQFLHQVMHLYPQKCKVFLSSINSRRSSHLQPLKKWIHTFILPLEKITRLLLSNPSFRCYFSCPYACVHGWLWVQPMKKKKKLCMEPFGVHNFKNFLGVSQ